MEFLKNLKCQTEPGKKQDGTREACTVLRMAHWTEPGGLSATGVAKSGAGGGSSPLLSLSNVPTNGSPARSLVLPWVSLAMGAQPLAAGPVAMVTGDLVAPARPKAAPRGKFRHQTRNKSARRQPLFVTFSFLEKGASLVEKCSTRRQTRYRGSRWANWHLTSAFCSNTTVQTWPQL